jgi:hypothetical protein
VEGLLLRWGLDGRGDHRVGQALVLGPRSVLVSAFCSLFSSLIGEFRTNWDQRGTSDVWWYVMCSWTFYWSELVVLHLNAKKKDFYPTLIHHVTSIILLYFAWNSNLSRIFMVGFVLIDCSDIPLEVFTFQFSGFHKNLTGVLQVSKMTLYLGHDKVSRVAYFTFVFVWIVTRLGYLPFWAVKR